MPNLLFSSGFEANVALAAPSGEWQSIVGNDTTTGYSWPSDLWGGQINIQLLTGGGNQSQVISNSIETVAGHGGGQTKALHLNLLQKPSSTAQDALLLLPSGGAAPGDFTVSGWFKLPENLGAKLGSGGWLTPGAEWKSAGDFRVITVVEVDNSGTPYWRMKWDTDANGNVPLQTFWTDTNRSVPVPQGEWFHMELTTHRGNTDGHVTLKVNGQTVFDHTGDNIGQNEAPINRIFLGNAYSNVPIDIYVDDLQVWDGPPGTSVPPVQTPVTLSAGSGPDALVLKISQDAYQGSAQYTVSVDGKQIGETFTASASHSAGQSDTLTVRGDWATGDHRVSVNFLNDAWDGTAATDRNLYVDAATYNGAAVSGAASPILSNGSADFSVTDTTGIAVTKSTSYTLQPAESDLTLTGSAAVNGAGNALDNTVAGNAGANSLWGKDGNDTLRGGGGADSLYGENGADRLEGEAGNDVLQGGIGADILLGGAGADRFVFRGTWESPVGNGARDLIQDFSPAEGDKIDLSGIDANTRVAGDQAFSFIGSRAFTGAAGQARVFSVDGHTVVEVATGDHAWADMRIDLGNATSLRASDFLL